MVFFLPLHIQRSVTQFHTNALFFIPKQIRFHSSTHASVSSLSDSASASLPPVFPPRLLALHHLSVSSVLLSLPPSLPSNGGLVPFHNSWSCSYGSGSHVGCESFRLKGSLNLHYLSRGSNRLSCCAPKTKSTCLMAQCKKIVQFLFTVSHTF